MEINKEVSIKITVSELEKIVIEHLKNKGYNIDKVTFNVGAHYQDDDWRGEYASTYRLNDVLCKGKLD